LNHRVPCCGFRFSELEKPRNIRPEVIEKYDLSIPRIRQIKQGKNYTLDNGTVIPNAELTVAPEPPASYAFCSDTAYAQETVECVKGVDLLYHESTFLNSDAERAKMTFHSTAEDAAKVAAAAEVKQLMLGHYSSRYRSMKPFLDEARVVFENVVLADEGLTLPVKNVNKKSKT
jgi:ribonuclease Z